MSPLSGCPLTSVRRRAFSFVSVIVAASIVLAVVPALCQPMRTAAERVVLYLDMRKASAKTAEAMSVLRWPLFYCGCGMPCGAADFRRAFGGQGGDPFCWEGPLSVEDSADGRANAVLKIAYAMPSGMTADRRLSYSSSDKVLNLMKLHGGNTIRPAYETGASVNNWIILDSVYPPSVPFRVKRVRNRSLTIENYLCGNADIPRGAEVSYLCAMRIYAYRDVLMTNDFRTSGNQPRVSNVVDMRFKKNEEKNLVTVYLLVRGDVKNRSGGVVGADSWPDEWIKRWKDSGSGYTLYASKHVWGMPNCDTGKIFAEGKRAGLF